MVPDDRAPRAVTVNAFRIHGIAGANVRGELDALNVKHAESFLASLAAAHRPFIVSLEGCTHFEATGIALLLRLRSDVGRGLTLVVPATGPLRTLLTVAGLANKIRIVESIDDAVSTLGDSAIA